MAETLFRQIKTAKAQQLLTSCVDCACLSSPAVSPSLYWRTAEARYYSWRKLESGHKYFFIQTRANLGIRISFLKLIAIVTGFDVMSIFLKKYF